MPRKNKKTYEENRQARIRSYGLSIQEYDQMLHHQDGACWICKGVDPNRALSIDHDHKTGFIRGLLCSNHNRALGLFGDDPELVLRAYLYLTKDQDVVDLKDMLE